MKIRLPARLFRAGDYPDKKYKATTADLDSIVGATRQTGGSPPLDLHHADTDETFDLGSVPADSVRRDGDWIVGQVEVEQSDLPRFKQRGLSVVIDRATKAISKVTVTGRPRVAGAGFEQTTESDHLVFDGGYLMDPKDDQTTSAEETSVETKPGLTEEAVGNIVTRTLRKLFGGEPAAEAAALSNDTATQAVADAVAAVKAEFAAELAKRDDEIKALKEQSADFSDDRIATEISAAITRGVPPVIADNLVPLAFGRDEIAFTDAEGKAQTRDVAAAAREVLAFAAGKVPQGGKLGLTTSDDAVSFDERSAKRADEIFAERSKADATFTRSDAQRLADDELLRKEA